MGVRSKLLSRRAVLRGLGGIAVALPFLEGMAPKRALASPAPRRFVPFFTANGNVPQGTGDGADFALTPELSALAPHRKDLLLLTGFNNQVAAHSPGDNHQRGIGCMLTGAKLGTEPLFCEALCEPGAEEYVGWATGPSLDQVLARTEGIGDQTRFPSLELGVGVQIGTVYARMSYASGGRPVAPEDDPLAVFNRLFGQASPELRARRKSVLDTVSEDYAALDARLGAEDRRRLDAHLTAVREIELTHTSPGFSPAGTCQLPAIDRPGDIYGNASYPAVGKAQMDLLVMALACDLTRVASLQWDTSVSNVVHSWLPGVVMGHHDLSHEDPANASIQAQLRAIEGWYASQLAYLIAALGAVPEGEGTLLDSTVVLWCNELSKGFDHTLHDLHWMLAGSCGGAFDTGRLVRLKGDPHNDLLLSIANAMGSSIDSFGDPEFCLGPMAGLST